MIRCDIRNDLFFRTVNHRTNDAHSAPLLHEGRLCTKRSLFLIPQQVRVDGDCKREALHTLCDGRGVHRQYSGQNIRKPNDRSGMNGSERILRSYP